MPGIVALTNGSPHSWIVLNAVAAAHGPLVVLVEPPEPKSTLIRRRMKRQGVLTVAGQIGFVLLQRQLAKRNQSRVDEILATTQSNCFPAANCRVQSIPSVNAVETRDLIASLAPDVVMVFGTRVIGRETLSSIKVPVINCHSGINPKYRGQAGGYWALAEGDAAHAGVTVHLVDQGVDTGDVLYQANFQATPKDDFNSYFYLQAALMRQLAVNSIGDALQGKLKPYKPDLPSRQFYHPTLWFYLWTAWRRGVW